MFFSMSAFRFLPKESDPYTKESPVTSAVQFWLHENQAVVEYIRVCDPFGLITRSLAFPWPRYGSHARLTYQNLVYLFLLVAERRTSTVNLMLHRAQSCANCGLRVEVITLRALPE